jgi:hypothetical protein
MVKVRWSSKTLYSALFKSEVRPIGSDYYLRAPTKVQKDMEYLVNTIEGNETAYRKDGTWVTVVDVCDEGIYITEALITREAFISTYELEKE